jgi:hypothetical protein
MYVARGEMGNAFYDLISMDVFLILYVYHQSFVAKLRHFK